MKNRYLWKRILFSIFSLFVVVLAVMTLVYSLIDRSAIFQTDDVWNKRSGNDRTYYEYTMYSKYGYLDFVNYTTFLQTKYTELYGPAYTENEQFINDRAVIQTDNYSRNPSVKEFIAKYESEGYKIVYLKPLKYTNGRSKPGGTGYLLAVDEKNQVSRLITYFGNFFHFESKNDVTDPALTDRYVRFEKDPYSGLFAIVGSGTEHKYQLYFDGRFPFIHQNWFSISLGTSFTRFRGQEITTVITQPTGDLKYSRTQYPNYVGTDRYDETAIDFHQLTYNYGTLTDYEKEYYPDKYTVIGYNRTGLSMLENSFVIGIIATVIAYLIGLPLGILMSKNKDSIGDKIGNAYIIFISAVPSLAYIFMFAAIGTRVFHLPYKFANASVMILAYILPVLSLALRDIAGHMRWMRRFMIDQMNSDYVKFARAEGLSEGEIFGKHISKNAVIPIVHGIPGSILGCLVGAIITERVYSVPGVGNLLTTAINSHDNGIIVACTVFYTTLSLISMIAGDLLMAKYDPRISFENNNTR